MKKLLTMFLALCVCAGGAFGLAACTDQTGEVPEEWGNVLVVYYSATGNTEEVAGYIAEATGGDVFELVPVEPYTSDDLRWTDDNSRVSVEHENEELQNSVELVSATPEPRPKIGIVTIPCLSATPSGGALRLGPSTALSRQTILPTKTSCRSARHPAPVWVKAVDCLPTWRAKEIGWKVIGSVQAPATSASSNSEAVA